MFQVEAFTRNNVQNRLVIDFNTKISVLRQAAKIDLANEHRTIFMGIRVPIW